MADLTVIHHRTVEPAPILHTEPIPTVRMPMVEALAGGFAGALAEAFVAAGGGNRENPAMIAVLSDLKSRAAILPCVYKV